MKVGFPHMGNAWLAAKAVLDDLGVDYVVAPPTSRRTLELGARHTPEGACLPLKITVGNLMEACELGADTQLMVGSWGPCRFGYYCQMQREILQDAGCAMEPLHLEVCAQGPSELARRVRRLAGRLDPLRLGAATLGASSVATAADSLERAWLAAKSRETRPGRADALYNGAQAQARDTRGSRALCRLLRRTEAALHAVEPQGRPKLRVGLVGEIYGTIDPWTNMDLQSRLAAMGVYTERHVTVSHWVNEYMLKKALHLPRDIPFVEASRGYIGADIGGHTRETLGHTVLHARQGFDGVIQLYPLGCMPEIVAQTILPEVSRDYDLPVLTLILDEMTGEAGYLTRLEAFVDLLTARKEAMEHGM